MFTKYNSIENSYRDKSYFGAFEHPESQTTLWNVTEKLDGTNFSFVVTADGVRPAKRTNFIHENEKFFGFQDIFEPLKKSAIAMYNSFKHAVGPYNEINVVQIYGEYVGSNVLNRVDYKQKGFYVFDIKVNDTYLESNTVLNFCNEFGFIHTPVLFQGTVAEVKEFHDQWQEKGFSFNSTITLDQNHGKIIDSEITNEAEGFVIKPNIPLYELRGGSRVILKCKTPRFSEKKQSEKKKHVTISERDNNALNELTAFVTESRLFSIISKYGEINTKDFSSILKLFVIDIKEQYEQDNTTELHLNCDNVSGVIQMLNKECAIELRKDWLNLIDKS